MHFGFTLDSSDIDLWNDTHLDLWDTGIPNKHFAYLQDVLKTSSRHFLKTSTKYVFKTLRDMSSRRLQDISSSRLEDVFSVAIFLLPRRLQDVLRDVFKTSWKTKNCSAEDVFKTCFQDVLKTNKCLMGYYQYCSKSSYYWSYCERVEDKRMFRHFTIASLCNGLSL